MDPARLFLLTVPVYLFDFISFSTWQPAYLRHGLLIFRRSHRLPRPIAFDVELRLAAKIRPGPEIKSLGAGEWAIRELRDPGIVGRRFPLLMRGLLSLDHTTQTVTTTGRLNWYILATIVLFAYFALFGTQQAIVFAVMLVFFAVIYLLQAWAYAFVVRKAADDLIAHDQLG